MARTGRPSKYKPEYCQKLIEFYHRPSTHTGIKKVTLKNGTVIEEECEYPNKPAHVVDFCDELNINITTFYEWIKVHPAFSKAYMHAKQYLERNITDNALLHNYNPGFASLVSKNWLGWKDKQDVEHGGDVTIHVVEE